MRRLVLIAALLLAGISTASAAPLKPELSGLAFLLGTWAGGGKVADTGGSARGKSHITAEAGGGPVFRLAYELKAPDGLEIAFAMAPPGQTAFNPIATGTVHRTR